MLTSTLTQDQRKATPAGTWYPPATTQRRPKSRRPKLACNGMRFLSFWERLLVAVTCLQHQWTMPATLKEYNYPIKAAATATTPEVRYDSHQTCTRCASHRLYHTKTWSHGPMFRRVVKTRGEA